MYLNTKDRGFVRTKAAKYGYSTDGVADEAQKKCEESKRQKYLKKANAVEQEVFSGKSVKLLNESIIEFRTPKVRLGAEKFLI